MNVVDSVLEQYNKNSVKNSDAKKIDLTKYFNATLPPNVKEAEYRFRILPVKEGASPFQEAWFHVLQIKGKWRKFYDPKKNDGGRSPLSEVEEKLLSTGIAEDKKIANQYKSKRFYVLKGIDRDNPQDGVKFWRFSHNWKAEGIFDKIIPLYKSYGNIADYKTGRDLTIYVGRDSAGKPKVNTVIASDPCVLGTPEEMKLWLSDQLTWRDVFKAKTTDYLEVVAKGDEPTWSGELNKFIGKDSSPMSGDVAELQHSMHGGKEESEFEFNMEDLPF